jgi:glycerol-3-phosphate dehydrogenase
MLPTGIWRTLPSHTGPDHIMTRRGHKYHSPWTPGWREEIWSRLQEPWDLIIIGGGVTGAGILSLAAQSGAKVLLLEKGDFASGTSSRSSKMVHGGLRYLKHMQIKLTLESVRERQRLLESAPGLVEPLGFVYPLYEGERPSPWVVGIGLGIYTRLAPDTGDYQRLDEIDIGMMAPGLKTRGLERAYHYMDAQTDDARLVLRVLHDGLLSAQKGKAAALNYASAARLLREGQEVRGVVVRDELTGERAEARARLVINATGAWADELRLEVGEERKLRPLRGSHLYFSLGRFPVYQAVAFGHPEDGRPVFVYPWEGVALVGTTDVDHSLPMDAEISISVAEADYLLRAVQSRFPELELARTDVVSTQAGVRPVVDTGKAEPSAESRDHVVWLEHGLLTVTGGKLTTFRLIAVDVLKEAHKIDSNIPEPDADTQALTTFDTAGETAGVGTETARRLWGWYGAAAPHLVASFGHLLQPVPGTPYLWAELAWAAGHEPVCHLDDLLLRRFRLGILLADGGLSLEAQLKAVLQKPLGWADRRWDEEVDRYRGLRRAAHGLPEEWEYADSGHR